MSDTPLSDERWQQEWEQKRRDPRADPAPGMYDLCCTFEEKLNAERQRRQELEAERDREIVGLRAGPCPRCRGSGKIDDADPGDISYSEFVCPECNGTGTAPMTDADLEVCRVTAEACGHEVVAYLSAVEVFIVCKEIIFPLPTGRRQIEAHTSRSLQGEKWNPLEIPAQMVECVDKLLSLGYWLALDGRAGRYHQSFGRDGVDEGLSSNCPWREFPARALAEVWRNK